MASALLASRQVPSCLSSQRHSARTSAFRSRPVPFTPARRVFARAQEAASEAPVTDEELAQLVEEEEDEILDDLDAVYAEAADDEQVDEDFELDEQDPDLLAGLEAAQLMMEDFDTETAAAVGAALDEDEDDKALATAALEDILANKLSGDGLLGEAQLAEIAAGVPEEALEAADLEDFVPAMNSDRYEERPLSADDKEAIAPYKLTKGELRNLLPQDWDQINVDFFSNKKDENIPLPEFRLNVLWTEKNLAVAIDQVYSRGQVSPLTEYYFWPRQDAWEELRVNLEMRPWISERDRIILLNRLTQLINFWQDEEIKHTVEEARAEFPDCAFAIA
ncbi:hypothetical protein PLESTB_000094800 [Pleodorina starrii]|uniref:30S ribosomal protein 3, chloroplastic n=1 Tax=Pleodorina starrii TaxID=330485 RepID=A0A9W6BAZ9_9CHLO|nr:hypothetical protein PLESTM_000091300 [Pleodorina starrii]GLC48413.1 hypothetical protein PLESTB_000094800 [Pleodorina starrii]GLC71734.1 hypothetical protein PLESTF_001160500 [Pleodorina starrii]